ncbi:hypothetical protein BDW22DRAFT_1359234 [Trametopsis cervina]|nr:hypothetical protein BDW22DRAFT_1359234 [Trametopsis cervina]
MQTSKSFHITANVAWVVAVVTDIVITLTLVYYLYRNRRVGITQTKNMMGKLIHYSVTTGLLTAIGSLVVLITYNAYPHSLLFAGLVEALSKLYANSALAMLNARHIFASTSAVNGSNAIELSQFRVASQGEPHAFVAPVRIVTTSSNLSQYLF